MEENGNAHVHAFASTNRSALEAAHCTTNDKANTSSSNVETHQTRRNESPHFASHLFASYGSTYGATFEKAFATTNRSAFETTRGQTFESAKPPAYSTAIK